MNVAPQHVYTQQMMLSPSRQTMPMQIQQVPIVRNQAIIPKSWVFLSGHFQQTPVMASNPTSDWVIDIEQIRQQRNFVQPSQMPPQAVGTPAPSPFIANMQQGNFLMASPDQGTNFMGVSRNEFYKNIQSILCPYKLKCLSSLEYNNAFSTITSFSSSLFP